MSISQRTPSSFFQQYIYILFFLSGFSALIYEVAWMRVLGLVLGNSNQAASCVLAAFLGGLAIGAVIGGRLADRMKQGQLFAYGLVEIGVALCAPIVTFALTAVLDMIATNHSLLPPDGALFTPVRLLIAAVLLIIPTVLMGSTLPFLVKLCSRHWHNKAHIFSSLYAINTLGAVAGSLIATFVLFAYLGISGAVFSAAGVSLLVGLSAITLSGKLEQPTAEVDSSVLEKDSDTVTGTMTGHLSLLCGISFILGFASLSYEVLWNRLIRFNLATDTYAFTLMVSTFLLGLVIGAWIHDRWLAKQRAEIADQLSMLAIVQFATAIACAASLMLMPLGSMLRRAVEGTLFQIFGSLGGTMASHLVVTATFILIPSTLIGISFPLIGGLATALNKDVGKAVGLVYAANTIGCVLGSISAGLLLIPALGSYTAFQITIAITVLAGLIALFRSSVSQKQKIIVSIGVAIYAIGFGLTRSPYQIMAQSGKGPLIHFDEDSTSTVLVLKYPDFMQLVINGQPYANTILNGRRYMRVLGHLPALLHPNPESALNICFGTGTTAGSMALHPGVKSVDVVDLSSAVLKSANYFTQSNYGVANKSKTKFHIGDGRNYLLCSDKKYDIVSFEPPPPLEAGTTSLYSEEFYRLAKSRLKPGGIMCQWIPFDQPNDRVWGMMLRSAKNVFPYTYVFEPNDAQAILIGSNTPVKTSFVELQKRMTATPEIRDSLAEVGLDNAYALLATYLFGNEKAAEILQTDQGLTITDDQPRLEFFLPYPGKVLFTSNLEKYKSDPHELLTDTIPNQTELQKHFQAMTHLRLAEQVERENHDHVRAHEEAQKALELFPSNRFFQFVEKEQYKLPAQNQQPAS